MHTPFSTIGSIHDSHCIAFTGIPNINVKNLDPYKILKSIKVSNINRLIIGQLNINSLRNKMEALKLIMTGNLDILIITESKLDETFPKKQFCIKGYAPPFRAGRTKMVGLLSFIFGKIYLVRYSLIIPQLLILKVSFLKSISRKENG